MKRRAPNKRARPERALPVVENRRAEIETCAYCPRLCRAECPISQAEPRESLTPWGKMSSLLADEPAPELSWACTGCGACTELCLHKNPVAQVLIEARSSHAAEGREPSAAREVARSHPSRVMRQAAQVERLSHLLVDSTGATTGVLLGCSLLRKPGEEVEHVVRTIASLAQGPVRLLEECCGLAPALAGDAAGHARDRERSSRAFARLRSIVVVDPGCYRFLEAFPGGTRPELIPFEAWVARENPSLELVAEADTRYVWQVPCWARGTSAEPAQRVLLRRLLGDAVDLDPPRGCSGGGALLPQVHPEISRAIARQRADVLRGRECSRVMIVAGCASSARRFNRALDGTGAAAPSVLLSTLVWQGLRQ